MQMLTRLRVLLMFGMAVSSVIIATAVAVVAVRPPAAQAAVAAADDLRSTITTVGDGRVLVQPDVANVSFGVEATAQTQAAAQADAATRMQAVVDKLLELGIPREEIRTNRLSARPVYDQRNPGVVQGYQTNNSVQVKIRNLDQVGAIVDAVTAAGANRVDGISFAVEQIETPKGQARGVAIQNARTKADQLASLTGLRVVGIRAIQESDPSSNPPRPQPARADAYGAAAAPPPPVEQIETPKGQARGVAIQNARTKADQLASLTGLRVVGIKAIQESDASSNPPRPQPARADAYGAAAAPPPPVEPGTQEVSTQVTVTYIVE